MKNSTQCNISFVKFIGVTSMGYFGSYPVSKFIIQDRYFDKVGLQFFGYSVIKPRDSKTSTTPAIAFTLRIRNCHESIVRTPFMLNLPLGIQHDIARLSKPYASFKNESASQCARLCDIGLGCVSWQVVSGNKTCMLFSDMSPHVWHPSTWKARDSLLTLNRPGNYLQGGNTNILTNKGVTSVMVNDSFAQIWKQFS